MRRRSARDGEAGSLVTERVRGSVINVHALGAAVRLEDGRLVSVPLVDVNKNRASYTRALGQKTTLPFDLDGRSVTLAMTRVDEPIVPSSTASVAEDPGFEAQIAAYLKQTESWAPAEGPPPLERHLFRKRARAKHFRGDPAP
jgi:hypothetical protein